MKLLKIAIGFCLIFVLLIFLPKQWLGEPINNSRQAMLCAWEKMHTEGELATMIKAARSDDIVTNKEYNSIHAAKEARDYGELYK
jgi:uncharacterized membrane protein YebE (DUF533 family)